MTKDGPIGIAKNTKNPINPIIKSKNGKGAGPNSNKTIVMPNEGLVNNVNVNTDKL